MRAATAYSDLADSQAAAQAAAEQALAALNSPPSLALGFATVRHDLAKLRDGLRRVLGVQTRLLIGGAVGALDNRHCGYDGHQFALALIAEGAEPISVLAEPGMDRDEQETGLRLGRRLQTEKRAPSLLLYDAKSQRDGRGRLNMATPLLAGLRQAMGELPPLVGAGLIGDMAGGMMPQLLDDDLLSQQAIAVDFGAGARLDAVIMHGCQPATGYYRITRADGNLVYELDHRPILDVLAEWLGPDVPPEQYAFFVTLGMNRGDKWGPFREEDYVNRLCLKVDRKRQALMMFEPDLIEGEEVQLMVRSLDLDYIAPRIEALFSAQAGRRPVLALYINCAGRAAAYAGLEQEDAHAVQQAVAGRAPLLGFYSGVEIGPIQGRPTPLDWTGVFCLLSVPHDDTG
ncbi:FIST N-terminal domain-containing protein [Chromobacterium sp. IIBBL 290-4]|uniref:FIST N-terminal domain-containing protein n=1 Tax=Chromobacterium sp. IIBBL 290-4 TaxID=2953890 RepID=UPI0020B8394A|nr:FIST N-terminal domain-containing protein [Chromobacterium sp. IIBBL 290-4]UTH74613.1 FIST C-terminal domain-containing protein [Chromobacterium sp. IIBBL 290-4]